MRDFAEFRWDAWLRQRSAEVFLALGLGLMFAFFGPYRTYEQAFLARLGFWAGLMACWYVVASFVETALGSLAVYRRAGPFPQGIALVATTSAPMILIVAPAAHAMTGWQASVWEVAELYWQTALVGCVMTLARKKAPSSAAAPAAADAGRAPSPAATTVPPQASRLIARLSPELRGRLICLQMEDHYVRVHTERGSSLLLLRLGDAMSEAEPIPGLQIHRSWWVARDAVMSFERIGRTGQLTLSNGVTAPVSQRHLEAVLDALR